MLVLTRRLNQSIKIGDDIEIMVIEVRGDQVRLGVNAPRDIAVHRKEVYLQIQQENQNAARESASTEAVSAALHGLLSGHDAPSGDVPSAPSEPRKHRPDSLTTPKPVPVTVSSNGGDYGRR